MRLLVSHSGARQDTKPCVEGETPMNTHATVEQARRQVAAMLHEAGIVLTPQEEATIEIADMGLGEFEH